MKKRILAWFLFVILPLAVGSIFYYMLCPDVLFVQKIDELTGLGWHFPIADTATLPYVFFRNYGIDFLWAFAFMSSAKMIAGKAQFVDPVLWPVLIMEIILECCQVLPAVNGTFDICDILIEIMANVIADIIVIKFLYGGAKNEKI